MARLDVLHRVVGARRQPLAALPGDRLPRRAGAAAAGADDEGVAAVAARAGRRTAAVGGGDGVAQGSALAQLLLLQQVQAWYLVLGGSTLIAEKPVHIHKPFLYCAKPPTPIYPASNNVQSQVRACVYRFQQHQQSKAAIQCMMQSALS